MTPSGTAFDTSVICYPFDRRFVLCAWQQLGAKVAVLPRVAHELHGIMCDNEIAHWQAVLKGEEGRGGQSYSSAEWEAITSAAGKGAQAWVRQEIDSQAAGKGPADSALRAVVMSAEERGRAGRLASEIPAYCFRGPSRDGHAGDRRIIAEARVMGFQVLASKNRTSIRRAQTNHWLRSRTGMNVDLVQEADAIVGEMFLREHDNLGVPALKAVLHAALPANEVSPQRQCDIVERFLENLGAGSFVDCAEQAEDVWRGPDGDRLAMAARRGLVDSPARETEARRVQVVREQAAEAGWAPSP